MLEEQLNTLKNINEKQDKAYHKACYDLEEASYKLDEIKGEKNHIERELTALK